MTDHADRRWPVVLAPRRPRLARRRDTVLGTHKAGGRHWRRPRRRKWSSELSKCRLTRMPLSTLSRQDRASSTFGVTRMPTTITSAPAWCRRRAVPAGRRGIGAGGPDRGRGDRSAGQRRFVCRSANTCATWDSSTRSSGSSPCRSTVTSEPAARALRRSPARSQPPMIKMANVGSSGMDGRLPVVTVVAASGGREFVLQGVGQGSPGRLEGG